MQERIRHFVLQVIEEFQGIYLVDLRVRGPQRGRKIEIILDTDTGIRIDECARVSRRMRDLIESSAELLAETGEDFEITVSSPGLGEPLKLDRQYFRHKGRPLRVSYTGDDGTEKEVFGRLAEVMLQDEGNRRITLLPINKKGGTSKKEKQSVTLSLDQIVRSVPEADM
ncbi:MAG: ribosome maturation factor RimP [Chlorobiaceae bacterium]|nr:ribosome maturation factor RimP [Chlorobiaceae bacterium]